VICQARRGIVVARRFPREDEIVGVDAEQSRQAFVDKLAGLIPIVFTSGTDPVAAGLVTSLNRPEANVTGVSWFNVDLGPKLLDLVRELAPGAIVQMKPGVLVVAADPFLAARAGQLVVLAARNNLPLVSTVRYITAAGGLMSYGNNNLDAYRRAGAYVGRILKGARTADLPIDRAVKFDLVINLQTAKTLKRDIPVRLLALADEVIE
jgi:ABC-type uncharacterized transport system substrate-binding protein